MTEMRFQHFSEMELPRSAQVLIERVEPMCFLDPQYFIKFRASKKDIQKLIKELPPWAATGKWEKGKIEFWNYDEENAEGQNFRQFRSVTGSTVYWTLGIDIEKSVVFFEYSEM
jgi:hypothetical protein